MAARMALRSLSLLVWMAVALLESCLGASSHSLKYFYTSISEPSHGQPHFITEGYVDSQVFVHYDSHSRRMEPRVSWMEEVGKEDPQYWNTQTQVLHGHEEMFRKNLEIARFRYNQSEGLHTLQLMYGCELQADGSKGGFYQYGYDGRTFLTFDKETLSWVAPDLKAQITQRKWDGIPGYNQGKKAYLEETCIEWLEKYLSYGYKTLLRTEPPEVTVSGKREMEDGMETHVCRLHGFYPREIDASWTRDGEQWLQDTFHGYVAPNADGTYHYWIGIQINAKERGRYRCHMEHDSLEEPLDVALEDICVSGGKQKTINYQNFNCMLKLDPPEVTLSIGTKEVEDGMETHVCRLDGFYPRDSDASWRRDREEWLQGTLRGSKVTNKNGTIHTWLRIRIDPQKRGHYHCHMEQDDLQEPLDVALEAIGVSGEKQRIINQHNFNCMLKLDPPEVTLSIRTKKVEDEMETHVCRLDGFYLREIDAWLSIRINPKDRGHYRCHMEHNNQQEPLDMAIKGSNQTV